MVEKASGGGGGAAKKRSQVGRGGQTTLHDKRRGWMMISAADTELVAGDTELATAAAAALVVGVAQSKSGRNKVSPFINGPHRCNHLWAFLSAPVGPKITHQRPTSRSAFLLRHWAVTVFFFF